VEVITRRRVNADFAMPSGDVQRIVPDPVLFTLIALRQVTAVDPRNGRSRDRLWADPASVTCRHCRDVALPIEQVGV